MEKEEKDLSLELSTPLQNISPLDGERIRELGGGSYGTVYEYIY